MLIVHNNTLLYMFKKSSSSPYLFSHGSLTCGLLVVSTFFKTEKYGIFFFGNGKSNVHVTNPYGVQTKLWLFITILFTICSKNPAHVPIYFDMTPHLYIIFKTEFYGLLLPCFAFFPKLNLKFYIVYLAKSLSVAMRK